MIYIGIDPGVQGGLAAVDDRGDPITYQPMPSTLDGLDTLVRRLAALDWQKAALLECVRSSPQMGVVSAFTFGRGLGRIEAMLNAHQIHFEEIVPKKWQTIMSCRSHGDKKITKHRATVLFPTVSITHAIADALLIAQCCRLIHQARERLQHGKEASQQEPLQREAEARPDQARPDLADERRNAEDIEAFEAQATGRAGAARHGSGAARSARQVLRRHR